MPWTSGIAEPTTTEGSVVSRRTIVPPRIRFLVDRLLRFGYIFRRSRLGIVGLLIILAYVVMALTAPVLTSLTLLRNPDSALCGTDFHVCSIGEAPSRYAPPDPYVWLGTDHLGRDIFSRLWWGSAATIEIGIMASVISMGLGTFIGMIAGYYGRWIDELLMRITDFFLVLPTIVLAIILQGLFRRIDILGLSAIIGIGLWASTARLVRSQVLSLKQRQFVERARAVGASDNRIVWVHIFPNAFSLVFAEAILTITVAILTESFLSFIGLGPNANTWGLMIRDASFHAVIERQLYAWVISPGVMIVMVALGFTLLGYALDEIFNPRLRKR